MSTAHERFAMRRHPAATQRRPRAGALGIAAAAVTCIAGAVAARAAAPLPPSSSGSFHGPIPIAELERYRAQGLTAPGTGDATLGVILWDEYRRARPPRDTKDGSVHGAVIGSGSRPH